MEFKYKTQTPNDVCPDLVDIEIYGHHRSAVIGNIRYWAFEEIAGRDLFEIHVKRGDFRR